MSPGVVFSNDDSIPMGSFSLTADAAESLQVDSIRIQLIKGTFSQVSAVRLFKDLGVAGTFEPGTDLEKAVVFSPANNWIKFGGVGGMDTLMPSEVREYIIVLDIGPGITTTDSFMFIDRG